MDDIDPFSTAFKILNQLRTWNIKMHDSQISKLTMEVKEALEQAKRDGYELGVQKGETEYKKGIGLLE